MRKVKLYIACSIDGYIATKDNDISFLDHVSVPGEDYGYEAFMASIDTVIMGRKTYDKIKSFNIPFPHQDQTVYVFSKSRTGHNEDVIYVNKDIKTFIEDLKKLPGKDIFLDGGAQLIQSFFIADVIDEMTISIVPTLLGDGISLFLPFQHEKTYELVSSRSFSSGLVQLTYKKKYQ